MATVAWFNQTTLRRADWVAALLITLAAVWLHIAFLIHAGGFWRDEVNTINLAYRHSLGEMANDSFPILMPLVVRGWAAIGLGRSDLCLRFLGVIVGLGILGALWATAWIARRSPPVLSLTLFGLSGTAITYGDSLRAFGLGSLLVVLTIAAMWAFLHRPSWRLAGFLGLTAVLSVQALFQNTIFVAATCIGGLIVCWRRNNWSAAAKIIVVGLLAAASLLPYWSRIVPMWESSPESGVSSLRGGFRPALVLTSLRSALGYPLAQYAWGFFALAVVVVGGVRCRAGSKASNLISGKLEAGHLPLFAATSFLTGLAGFAGFLWFASLRTQPWYFLSAMALTSVCFEFGLPALHRYLYWASLALVAAIALLAFSSASRAVQCRFTNVDQVAKRLAMEAVPEDFVLITPWNRGISFGRYFKGHTPWETVPPLEDHSIHRYDLLQKQTLSTDPMRGVFQRITTALRTNHHVWLVGTIDIPPVRSPLMPDLPPPPLPHTGWSAGPYVRRWTSQAEQFLRNHSRQFVELPLAANQTINSNENLGLWVVEGWEDPPNLSIVPGLPTSGP